MDRGREFAGEVATALKTQFGIQQKLITTRNPQSNAIIERIHQVVGDMIQTRDVSGRRDINPDFGWSGILSAIRHAVRSLVHTTTRATPTQLVFGRDALLNISFIADWQYIKERKQNLILQNNKRENKTRIDHTYAVGDQVMIEADPSRKLEGARFIGPYTVSQVYDNGTVRLTIRPQHVELSHRHGTSANCDLFRAVCQLLRTDHPAQHFKPHECRLLSPFQASTRP